MSDIIQPVQSVTTTEPTAANATTAGAIVQANDGGDTKTTISSLGDLKQKSPQVYKAMVQGIAMNICNEMKKRQDHLKELMQEYHQS